MRESGRIDENKLLGAYEILVTGTDAEVK